MAGYTAQEVAEILGWPVSRVYSFAKSEVIEPARDGRSMEFGFRDLVVLKGAQALINRNVSPAKVKDALTQLRDTLPAGASLAAARLEAAGNRVAVRQHGLLWELGTGQAAFDFSYRDKARQKTTRIVPKELDADDWFDMGVDDEELDENVALDCYRKALELDAGHADSHVNIGRIYQARGDWDTAQGHYVRALQSAPDHPIARFNLGTLLEEEGRLDEAVEHYLLVAEELPDARYNLARVYERTGRRAEAIRELKQMLRSRDGR